MKATYEGKIYKLVELPSAIIDKYGCRGCVFDGNGHCDVPYILSCTSNTIIKEVVPWVPKKGDKVLVSKFNTKLDARRYFSHMDGDKYACFSNGADEWGSEGGTMSWDNCVKWED